MDFFEEFIGNKDNKNCRALTCSSYKKVYEQKYQKKLEPTQTNDELATYGDALLKLALCHIFLDKVPNITEEKKQYEEDKYLIEVVAKHYNLLKYMKYDDQDDKIPREYQFHEEANKNPPKYIATTVEAVLGAIYLKDHDFESICKLVESWMKLEK